jgi:predicted PhzF superfamily epimerase YddE/YHI9
VPFQFHVHSNQVPIEKVISIQPHVQIVPTIERVKGKSYPAVSIVKGMTFTLVDLTDAPEVFAALRPGEAPEVELDRDWSPSFVGCLFYKIVGLAEQEGEPTIHNIQARMITHGVEDPGTGSACCALACYLALNSRSSPKPEKEEVSDSPADSVEKVEAKTKDLKIEQKTERMVFGIQQGIEMGRACTIAIEVDVKTDSESKTSIANIILSGRGTVFSTGQLLG